MQFECLLLLKVYRSAPDNIHKRSVYEIVPWRQVLETFAFVRTSHGEALYNFDPRWYARPPLTQEATQLRMLQHFFLTKGIVFKFRIATNFDTPKDRLIMSNLSAVQDHQDHFAFSKD